MNIKQTAIALSFRLLGALLIAGVTLPAAAQFEFQYQLGRLINPFSGEKALTQILTLQHAQQWKYGDSFIFLDFINDEGTDGFNDLDFYGEWYPTLSLSKIIGSEIKVGLLRDIGVVAGLNFGGDADVLKFLPGARLSWQIPGFIFLNTDFTAIRDHNYGLVRGGAPATENNFMFDVSWLMLFSLGEQGFAFTGHAEYISGTTDENGNKVNAWILAQPQLTWDLGANLKYANHLHVGIEYQYWRNKLGTDKHDNTVQLLVVFRF